MTSFLSKKRDVKSYEEKLATIPKQTRRSKMYAVQVFENFVQENYNRTIQDVIDELQLIRKTKDTILIRKRILSRSKHWNTISTRQNKRIQNV